MSMDANDTHGGLACPLRRKRRIIGFATVLIVMLPAALLCGARGKVPGASSSSPKEAFFSERSHELGLNFFHFNGMSGEYYFCEMVGPGGAFFDYDNDGDLDIYIVQGSMLGPKTLDAATFPPKMPLPLSDRLYRNDLVVHADGTRTLRFTDVTEAAGLAVEGYGMGVTAGDFDNDGDVDLYVSNFGPNNFLRNNGDGTFTDITAASQTQDTRWSTSTAFVDYDRDGWLDLFVCGYVDFTLANHKPCFTETSARDYCGPLSFDAIPDRLFRNLRTGTFEDVSAASHIAGAFGGALGIVCADLNGDDWIDLYVANDGVANQCWMNNQDGTFQNDALMSGTAVNENGIAEASMGVDAADFDGDGDEDLFMTHLNAETNTLYVNQGDGFFEDGTSKAGLGVASRAYTGFGTAWIDYDNDGWLDLLTANGAVKTEMKLARQGDLYPLAQTNQVFRNLGNGTFREVSHLAGPAFKIAAVSRGAAFGDIDNDGDTDVLILNNSGPARLLVNEVGNRKHWAGIRLLHPGPAKRDCLGARVELLRPGRKPLWRRVRSAGSYCSANDPRVLVGLGDDASVPTVRVHWPQGAVEAFAIDGIDRYHDLVRGTGEVLP